MMINRRIACDIGNILLGFLCRFFIPARAKRIDRLIVSKRHKSGDEGAAFVIEQSGLVPNQQEHILLKFVGFFFRTRYCGAACR